MSEEHTAENDVTRIVRQWVRDTAYAEDDFVLTYAEDGRTKTGTPVEVLVLLDQLDPDWRSVFPPGVS